MIAAAAAAGLVMLLKLAAGMLPSCAVHGAVLHQRQLIRVTRSALVYDCVGSLIPCSSERRNKIL